MLAAAGDALMEATRNHRHIKDVVRVVARLPQLDLEELLKRYAADAPALYWLPGTLRVQDDNAFLTFTLGAVVRNVAGADQAFAGDGLDIGVDHLLRLAVRAIHGHTLGGCSWSLVRAEMEDDPLFDDAGIAAMSMTFESSAIELAADWDMDELDSFKHFHADVDIPPGAGQAEHSKWLQDPPDHTTSAPDATVDVSLEGA